MCSGHKKLYRRYYLCSCAIGAGRTTIVDAVPPCVSVNRVNLLVNLYLKLTVLEDIPIGSSPPEYILIASSFIFDADMLNDFGSLVPDHNQSNLNLPTPTPPKTYFWLGAMTMEAPMT